MSVLSGILAGLCFPKFNLFYLATIALVPLFLKIEKEDAKSAFRSGYVFGLVFLGINLFWINTLNEFAPVFATLGWLFLVACEAVFTALACYCIKKAWGPFIVVLGPFIWIFFEWLRTIGPFGISAGVLGYSQALNIHLVQFAAHLTVFGLSFKIVMANLALTNVVITFRTSRPKALLKLAGIVAIAVALHAWGSQLRPQSSVLSSPRKLKISIIQGNIPQYKKLSMRYNAEIFQVHETMTRDILKEKPDIIIWPETTVLSYLLYDQNYLGRIRQLARDSQAYLIIGTPHYDQQMHIYNSIVVISPSGEVVSRYDKQRLVPFGEYLPLRFLFYPILKATNLFYDDFNMAPAPKLLNLGGLKIGGLICFESTFVDLPKREVKDGAQLLLTLTNDAWFRDSAAPYEHFNNGILRAVENRRYFIQAANTGISGVIGPFGKVLKQTKVGERTTLTFEIPLP